MSTNRLTRKCGREGALRTSEEVCEFVRSMKVLWLQLKCSQRVLKAQDDAYHGSESSGEPANFDEIGTRGDDDVLYELLVRSRLGDLVTTRQRALSIGLVRREYLSHLLDEDSVDVELEVWRVGLSRGRGYFGAA